MANSTFLKQINGIYNLVHDYSKQLNAGEIIKTYTVTLDGSGLLNPIESGLVVSEHSKYSNTKIITKVQEGIDGSGYLVGSSVVTNRNRTLTNTIDLVIDETQDPYFYNNFAYSFQTSNQDESIFILPDLNNCDFVGNTEYTVTVSPGLSGVINTPMTSSYSFWFTTQYCPLFATPNTIKLMGGPDIEGFADDTIYRMIHKNSIDAIDMLNAGTGNNYSYDAFGCTPENVPYHLRRYVECKTTYDLLNIADSFNNTGLSQSKHLGDMDISYGGSPGSSSSSKGDPKKDLYDCFNGLINLISTGGNGLNTAARGLYDTSKGFPHPVMDTSHNRIIRSVDTVRSNPGGPWTPALNWRYTSNRRRNI